jgi:hypothetical protein
LSSFDGRAIEGSAVLRPREKPSRVQFQVSGSFRSAWDAKGQTKKWNSTLDDALPELALIALGLALDDAEVPRAPTNDNYALIVSVSSHLFDIFSQEPATDSDLAAYVERRIRRGLAVQE